MTILKFCIQFEMISSLLEWFTNELHRHTLNFLPFLMNLRGSIQITRRVKDNIRKLRYRAFFLARKTIVEIWPRISLGMNNRFYPDDCYRKRKFLCGTKKFSLRVDEIIFIYLTNYLLHKDHEQSSGQLSEPNRIPNLPQNDSQQPTECPIEVTVHSNEPGAK